MSCDTRTIELDTTVEIQVEYDFEAGTSDFVDRSRGVWHPGDQNSLSIRDIFFYDRTGKRVSLLGLFDVRQHVSIYNQLMEELTQAA